MIWTAPVFLTEAAAGVALSAAVGRSARKAGSLQWIGGVLRATIVPMLIVLVVAVAAGWILAALFPDADKLSQVIRAVLR